QVPNLPGEKWRHPKESELFLNQDIGGDMPEEIPVQKMPKSSSSTSHSVSSTTQPAQGGYASASTQPGATTQPAPAIVNANSASTTQPSQATASNWPEAPRSTTRPTDAMANADER